MANVLTHIRWNGKRRRLPSPVEFEIHVYETRHSEPRFFDPSEGLRDEPLTHVQLGYWIDAPTVGIFEVPGRTPSEAVDRLIQEIGRRLFGRRATPATP